MSNVFIPPATADKLASVHPNGTRHNAAKDIAFSLIGNGMPENAVFATLQAKFDLPESEIQGIVSWASRQNPEPCRPSKREFRSKSQRQPESKPTRTPIEQCDWWTSGASVTPEEMASKSPTPIPAEPVEYLSLMLSTLFTESDFINIVCKFDMSGEKARPIGGGKTMNRAGWLNWIKSNGIPESKAGGWIRINPCAEVGSGSDNAPTDADVTTCKHLLVESDCIPVEKQLAILSKLRIPISAVVMSGGASAHAWIKIDAKNSDEYRELSSRLLDCLKPFGVDQSNKNPSRLCRLPGAMRQIGSVGTGEQKLLWLDSNAKGITQEGIKLLEDSLAFPAILERPLAPIANSAIARYEWMMANIGKLGVPSGIPDLDRISGGWKKGHTIVVAGASGGGKTTLGMHFIASALNSGYGVLLFSLEMDKDEIFDLIVSSRCRIDRNKFNTGQFTEHDVAIMAARMSELSKLPLYIEDAPTSTADQIRARALQLKADGKIGLIVVDYIQFVNPSLTGETREQQVAAISHSLRSLTREVQLPMVVLSQLNDEGKLRESRVIAHNANAVLLVEVDGDEVKISVVKGRGIPLGDYRMNFDRNIATLVPETRTITTSVYKD